MKKLLLSISMLFICIITNAQMYPSINNFVVTNTDATTATISYTVTPNNCTAGVAIELNYSTNSSLSPLSVINCPSTFTLTNRTTQITGLTPGTQYFVRVKASTGATCGNQTTNSAILNFTTSENQQAPTISNTSVNASGSATANLNYALNANGSATTTVVRYGTDANSLTNQVPGTSATGYTATIGSAVLTDLVAGTTYYYQIEATNVTGTTTSTVSSFVNLAPQNTHEYTFDNTYSNSLGGNAFASNSGTSFVNGRNGSPNGAININNTGSTATIPNLPYGNAARTVSVWVKLNALNTNTYNHIYSYGQNAMNSANGGSLGTNSSGQPVAHHLAYGLANNHQALIGTLTTNTWYHIVMTYDGTTSKIYRDAILVGSAEKSWNTVNVNDSFNIGSFVGELYFNGAIDDLKIYNFAVTAADVSSLWSTNALASETFQQNLNAVVSPNPATDRFTVATANDIKSITIYSLQGQKVLSATTREVNVSGLSKGIYVLRIEDVKHAVSNQKLIVK